MSSKKTKTLDDMISDANMDYVFRRIKKDIIEKGFNCAQALDVWDKGIDVWHREMTLDAAIDSWLDTNP